MRKYVVVKGSPEDVAEQLSNMDGDIIRTSDGQPVWTAPAFKPDGTMVVIVRVRTEDAPNPLDAPAAPFCR